MALVQVLIIELKVDRIKSVIEPMNNSKLMLANCQKVFRALTYRTTKRQLLSTLPRPFY